MHVRASFALGVALALSTAFAARAQPAAPPPAAPPMTTPSSKELRIPFEKYTLKNGLVVILSEDRTIPMVTVSTMVRVGSRFEPKKRTGFAHLFEHLMFMGTERVPTGKLDAWMEAEGGWNNAWISRAVFIEDYVYSVSNVGVVVHDTRDFACRIRIFDEDAVIAEHRRIGGPGDPRARAGRFVELARHHLEVATARKRDGRIRSPRKNQVGDLHLRLRPRGWLTYRGGRGRRRVCAEGERCDAQSGNQGGAQGGAQCRSGENSIVHKAIS